MCKNTVGGFTCTCNAGFWGNALACHGMFEVAIKSRLHNVKVTIKLDNLDVLFIFLACSTKPCPEGFYESESCTRTRDRVCKGIQSTSFFTFGLKKLRPLPKVSNISIADYQHAMMVLLPSSGLAIL